MTAASSVVRVACLGLTREDGQRRVRAAELRPQLLPELLQHVIVRLLARVTAVILLRDRPQIPFHRCPERHDPSLNLAGVSMQSIVVLNATKWIPACAGMTDRSPTRQSTTQKHPSH